MKMKSRVLCIIVALVVLAGMSAQAATVIVAPIAGDPNHLTNGWSTWGYNLGYGEMCTWGPPTYDNDSGSPFLPGRGAFYAETDLYKGTSPYTGAKDKNPSNVWLGMDTWQGQLVAGKALGSITKLEYYSFVASVPDRFGDGSIPVNEPEYWHKTSYFRYHQQPIYMTITLESPDGAERRQLWCRPWGGNFVGDDYPLSHLYKWERINCLNSKWYMPVSEGPADLDAYEMCFPTWTEAMNHQLSGPPPLPPFKDWKLVATNENAYPTGIRSGGWANGTTPVGHPNCTGTGKPINLFVGARVSVVAPRLFCQGEGSSLWSTDQNGFRGCVDYMTLGFNNLDETYNFEPAATTPTPRIVATTAKAIMDPIMGSNTWQSPPSVKDGTQRLNLFKLSGKVILTHPAGVGGINAYFAFDDGSGLKYTERWKDSVTQNWVTQVRPAQVWVFQDPTKADVRVGDQISAFGLVEPLMFAPANTPPVLWTVPLHINFY